MADAPVTIVTGASSGIGREVAILLAEAKRRLVLVGRRAEALAETIERARTFGASMDAVTVDLAEAGAADEIIENTLDRYGRIDEIVNNAGEAPVAAIDATTDDLLERTFAVNVFGPARLIALAWPLFVAQGGGRIVNVSSMAASDPFPGLFVYAATKAALESLVRSCAKEGAAHGIEAWSVAPGAVETAMLRRAFPDVPRERTLDPRAVAQVVADCLLGRRREPSGSTILVPSP